MVDLGSGESRSNTTRAKLLLSQTLAVGRLPQTGNLQLPCLCRGTGYFGGAVARVILAIGVGSASAAALMGAAERAAQASAIWWVSQTNRRML
jgi:hypothetical protein